jgi:ribonuclease E
VAEVAATADGEQGGETANNNDQAPRRDGEERRGRSRDRYGRDRRERGPRDDSEAGAPAAEGAVAAEAATSDSASYEAPATRQPQQLPLVSETVAAERQFAAAPEAREPAPQQQARFERPAAAPSPVAAPIVVETAKAAPAGNGRALPKVQPFELPLNELAQIAESSGLQWVNSDAERIAQARAAIAAEPKPVHVPRERPPAVVLDEGPLVLVETRRDLGSMSLPFEKTATDTQQPSTY